MTEAIHGRARRRTALLQDRLNAAGIDLLVLTPGTSWFYLTGISLVPSRLALMLVPRRGEPAWVVPRLEVSRVVAGGGFASPDRVLDYADGEEPLPVVRRAVAIAAGDLPGPPQVAAVEERVARLFEWRLLAQALPQVRWEAADAVMAALRACKDPEEQAAIRKAVQLAETALGHGAAFVQAGCRESQIAAEIEKALRQLGTWSPFGVHVASGPRSAVPHAETGDRLLQPGDLVWIDLGATVDGYIADITRTFLLPGAERDPHGERKREIYRICYRAQAAARAAARPGVRAGEVDAAARQVIAAAGYGDYFTHRTGHGLGLDVHEPPDIAPGNATILEPGMVFTVEPGIYLPEIGGVRIEDDILITAQGAQSLTRFRRWLAPGPAPAELEKD